MVTYIEPEGVTLEDGQKLRHDEYWLVLDDGRVRELRLRVGRGIVRESDTGWWRPMESAPRDGTEVLAMTAQGGCTIACFMTPDQMHGPHPILIEGDPGYDNEPRWFEHFGAEMDGITHWMPLPPLPAREEP